MSWKHEKPQEEFLREEMARQPEFGESGQPHFTVPKIPKERQQDDPVVPLETNGAGAEEVIPQRSFVSTGVKPLLSPPPGGLGSSPYKTHFPPNDHRHQKPTELLHPSHEAGPQERSNLLALQPRGDTARHQSAV
jgi:hypothetical protein